MTYNPYSLEMVTPFTFTVFYPEGDEAGEHRLCLEDGVTLSGKVCVCAYAVGYWPGPEVRLKEPDYFQMPRLCVDRRSPLLCWDNCALGPEGCFTDGQPHSSSRFPWWDINTRHYPNGLHALTVASWLWYHTGEGSGTTIEVFFSNPEAELTVPPPPVWNPNVPALLSQEKAGQS